MPEAASWQKVNGWPIIESTSEIWSLEDNLPPEGTTLQFTIEPERGLFILLLSDRYAKDNLTAYSNTHGVFAGKINQVD